VQVSGKTIYLPDAGVLPVHNIPVVHLGLEISDDMDADAIVAAFSRNADLLDLDPQAKLALAFTWSGMPEYPRLAAMARAIMRFAAPTGKRDNVLVLMIDGDVGRGLGRILDKELHLEGKLISVDGVQLRELDFVDIGELLDPPGVVPVVIKSLLFS
jgi:ethanolamine utilization protein EutA